MNNLVSLQWAGLVLALTTFVTIGAGHVMVRRLHARFGVRPAIPFFIIGSMILIFSIFNSLNLISAVLGITGITLVWDGIEIYRQEKRMQHEK
jgi:hypothetical protein